jgi:UDP-2-acetamido-3-amino-2,3-dideoxy-glucuronate N-acetyltransferase
VLGSGVYLGTGTVLGNRVKIQNGCGVFGARLDDDVLLAPGVYLLEDPTPRACRADGLPQSPGDWEPRPVAVGHGASIGANSTIAPGVVIGRCALVAIGSAVHRDVPDHALMAGNPGRQVGWVCACGARLDEQLTCRHCATHHIVGADGLVPVGGH